MRPLKRTLALAALALALATPAFAQSTPAATAPAAARTEEYCMVLAMTKFMSTKVIISIDFGQERKLFADNRYKNDEGKVQAFNSVIDALNFMNAQGWEFVNAYAITVANQNVYHYVMKRRMTP